MESIILIGHGSPRPEANNLDLTAKKLHTRMHPECGSACVKTAYMQYGKPDLAQAIEQAVTEGNDRIIVYPYFLTSGVHVTTDIPAMIDTARARFPKVEFIYTEPLGIHDKLIDVVVDRLGQLMPVAPRSIETKSFEILSAEIDLMSIPENQKPVIKRVIHTTADFEFATTMVFHPDAVQCGINALRAGKDILTDVEMIRTGINKKALNQFNGKVICGLETVSTVEDQTRAETGIETALQGNKNIGIIAIGNAPTALLKVINRRPADCLVIGVPVGFVKALESKVLLTKQSFPFITNISRKGGSTVAVAIVNALLTMAKEVT